MAADPLRAKAAGLIGFMLGAVALVVPWSRGTCDAYWNRHQCTPGAGEPSIVVGFWEQSHWVGSMARASTVLMVVAVVLSFVAVWQLLMLTGPGHRERGHGAALAAGVLYLSAGVTWSIGVGETGFGIVLIMTACIASFVMASAVEQDDTGSGPI